MSRGVDAAKKQGALMGMHFMPKNGELNQNFFEKQMKKVK